VALAGGWEKGDSLRGSRSAGSSLIRILMEVTGSGMIYQLQVKEPKIGLYHYAVAEMPSARKVFKGKINNTFCGLTAEECVEIVDVVIALKHDPHDQLD
jgi:hypothetical protein